MEFSIRKATIEDFTGLNTLFVEIDEHHRNALPHVFRKSDGPARSRDFLLGVIADQNAVIFLAENRDLIIGFAYAYVRSIQETPIRIPYNLVEIDQLLVKREYRRHGVGKALMERVDGWAVQKKIDRLELGVWNFNKEAQDFYRRLNYEPMFLRMWKKQTGPA